MDTLVKDDENLDRDTSNDASKEISTDTSAAEAAIKARLSRKRTKTGCLTCRKRRIKCGEERPVCKNCIKSKRHCEGYSQRVVFRSGQQGYQVFPYGGTPIDFQNGMPLVPEGVQSYTQMQFVQVPPPAVRPRPLAPHEQVLQAPQQAEQQQLQMPMQQQPFVPLMYQYPMQMQQMQQGQMPTLVQPVQFQPSAQQPQHVWMPLEQQQQQQLYQPQQPMHSIANGQLASAPTLQENAQGYGVWTSAVPSVNQTVQPVANQHPQYQIPVHSTPPQRNAATENVAFNPQILHRASQVSAVSENHISPTHSQSTYTLGGSQAPPSPSTSTAQQPLQRAWQPSGYTPRPELSRPIDSQRAPSYSGQVPYPAVPFPPSESPVSQRHPSEAFVAYATMNTPEMAYQTTMGQCVSPTRMLNDAAVEVLDDDYYDVEPEDEMDLAEVTLQLVPSGQRQKLIGNILARYVNSPEGLNLRQGLTLRRYDSFIYPGLLDSYRPERVANPLKNPATARVFAHFISATGPTLSIFERHSRNASVLLDDGPVPLSQQGIWTYTMPMAALHHQGLLHAMLAISSLHIAKLSGGSETPSMKHYAFALKRVHRSVGDAKKRISIETLAASQLLGFYEIMTADHMKWNSHLLGAKQLIVETDFAGMARELRRTKLEKRAREQQCNFGNSLDMGPLHYTHYQDDHLLDQVPDIDEELVGVLVGRKIKYDEYGSIIDDDDQPKTPPPRVCSFSLDLQKFETLKDLYWWYCKQDIYQSIISGNPLLMDYSRWTDCPPRAPLGKADAVYGSFDHLMLLLGRIANFASRDRKRKLKVMEANGGQWRPAPGMKMGPPPGAKPPGADPADALPSSIEGRKPSSGAPINPRMPPQGMARGPGMPQQMANPQPVQAGPPPQISFYGMAPPPARVAMPARYQTNQTSPTPSTLSHQDSIDLDTATKDALAEWQRIHHALDAYASRLGPNFQPLPEDCQQPLPTPFGLALFYRSYDISCLWLVYNMCVIIAERSHPHMPPAAHMAAGIAAFKTRESATNIGRITAGIVSPPQNQPLSPALGAAMCECCMALFIAGVQYQDPAQRRWTVERLFETDRRCGWATAGVIGEGCQTSWVKAAFMGRGPPWERIRNTRNPDARVNGSYERVGMQGAPDGEDEKDRRFVFSRAEARVHWAIGIIGTEEDVRE